MTAGASMVEGVHVRPLRAGDLPALDRVRAAAFQPIFDGFRQAVGTAIAQHALAGAEDALAGAEDALAGAEDAQVRHLAELCASGSAATVLVAERAGEVIGFVSYTTDVDKKAGEIGLNAVHPAHAGAGIGSHLYDLVLERMRGMGIRAVQVSTGGDSGHAAARRAYEKAGFTGAIPSLTLYCEL